MVLAVHHLVGAAEIGRMLGGISRQRVQQLIKSDDWPAPEVELDMGKVWRREDIEQWAGNHGRLIAGVDEACPDES
jgi:prophage regulatory protein